MTVPNQSGGGEQAASSAAPKRGKAAPPRPDQMSPEVFEFVTAIDDYKRANMRSFLSLEEILDIFQTLGYRKEAATLENAMNHLADAIDAYKREHDRLFPSWSEIFEIATTAGWER